MDLEDHWAGVAMHLQSLAMHADDKLIHASIAAFLAFMVTALAH